MSGLGILGIASGTEFNDPVSPTGVFFHENIPLPCAMVFPCQKFCPLAMAVPPPMTPPNAPPHIAPEKAPIVPFPNALRKPPPAMSVFPVPSVNPEAAPPTIPEIAPPINPAHPTAPPTSGPNAPAAAPTPKYPRNCPKLLILSQCVATLMAPPMSAPAMIHPIISPFLST